MRKCPAHGRRIFQVPAVAWLLAATLLAAALPAAADSGRDLVERGRYLVHAGGCITCHTADRPGARPLAGGRALATPFGTFYPPNLTPDPDTGTGRWTTADVGNALRAGRAPDGSLYYPVFPYPSYAGLTDEDVAAIAAYLRSLEPVRQPRRQHELPWYLSSRLVMYGWNLLNFHPQAFRPEDGKPAGWNRGAYLVRHLGHCGECHTPRNFLGAPEASRELAGNPHGPDGDKVPDITSSAQTGIGDWSEDDIVMFLESGMLPDGDFAGHSMSAVIDDNTSHLSAEDRRAIAVYLRSVPASLP